MDLTGRTIAVILDNPLQHAGDYELSWQSPPAFSGMLLLSFKMVEQVMVKELVIVK